jgi:hypothetical protein
MSAAWPPEGDATVAVCSVAGLLPLLKPPPLPLLTDAVVTGLPPLLPLLLLLPSVLLLLPSFTAEAL